MKSPVLIACLLLPVALFGQQSSTPFPSETDRLLATGRAWNTVRFFHPYLAYRDIHWQQALLSALPRIRQATDREAYRTALNNLLQPLSDPATRVVDASRAETDEASNTAASMHVVRSWMHASFASSYFLQRQTTGIETATLPMGAGLAIQVRLSEAIGSSLPPVPRVPASAQDASLAQPYPATEGRILAGFELWGVARQFFAYRDLMDEDWDQSFAETLPKLIAAKNASEYHLAMAEAATHLDDSGVSLASPVLDDYFGPAAPALRVQLIEKKPIVTDIYDPSVQSAGVHIGDIVIAVDGENIVDRIKREANYISFSTPQALSVAVSARVLNGAEGSMAALKITTATGEEKEVQLRRSIAAAHETHDQRNGDPVRLLPGQIGYVDLDRLPTDAIESAFSKLQRAKAIIFDGRGTTKADPLLLAGHLTEQNNVAGCIVTGPLWLSPDEGDSQTVTHTASRFEVRRVAHPNGVSVFHGKTVLLVDGRTAGSSELTGLYMQAANNTTFVGTPSAGALSDVQKTELPGGIIFSWSESDYQLANGGKLQRLGLQPSLLVPETVNDLRTGKDGVLTKAIALVLEDGSPQSL